MSESETSPILVVAIDGRVVGLDRETGVELWGNTLPGGSGGEVYLVVDSTRVFASALGSRLFCLDYLTGNTVWEVDCRSGRASIVVDGDLVVLAKEGHVDCYDRATGRHLWNNPLRGLGYGRIALGFPGNVAQADDPGRE